MNIPEENTPKRKRIGAKKKCCFGNCKSDTRCKSYLTENYYFISFPKPCLTFRKGNIKDKNIRSHCKTCQLCQKCNQWVRLCCRSDKYFSSIKNVNKDTYICSLHFVGGSGPTEKYPNPVKTVSEQDNFKLLLDEGKVRKSLEEKYCTKSMEVNKSSEKMEHNDEQLPLDEGKIRKSLEEEYCTNSMEVNKSSEKMEHNDEQNFETNGESMRSIINENSEDLIGLKNYEPNKSLNEQGSQTDVMMNAKGPQSEISCFCKCHEQQNFVQPKKNRDRGTQTPKEFPVFTDDKKFSTSKTSKCSENKKAIDTFESSLQRNDKKCKFYTGLDFAQILILLKFLSPACLNMNYIGSKQRANSTIRNHKFSIVQELIIVLMRLRLGLLVEDIAFRFHASVGHISQIFNTWIQCMYLEFKTHLEPRMFPSRQQINQNLPSVFKNFKNIRVILDCTEIFCQAPRNFEHQGNLYSQYKAHTTFKVLIGITPHGVISFVSNVYEGSISDRQIVIESKLVDKLEPLDLVLADRGFTIDDILEQKRAVLNIPPFLRDRHCLTPSEEVKTKIIAKQRIYVEHAIGRLKNFRILQHIFPLNMRGIINQIVFVCSCLTNFQNPIVFDD